MFSSLWWNTKDPDPEPDPGGTDPAGSGILVWRPLPFENTKYFRSLSKNIKHFLPQASMRPSAVKGRCHGSSLKATMRPGGVYSKTPMRPSWVHRSLAKIRSFSLAWQGLSNSLVDMNTQIFGQLEIKPRGSLTLTCSMAQVTARSRVSRWCTPWTATGWERSASERCRSAASGSSTIKAQMWVTGSSIKYSFFLRSFT